MDKEKLKFIQDSLDETKEFSKEISKYLHEIKEQRQLSDTENEMLNKIHRINVCAENSRMFMQELEGYKNLDEIMEENDNNIQLAFLGGIKAGLEALVCGLEKVAEINNGKIPIDFIKSVATGTIADVEIRLSGMKNGKGLVDKMNDNE